VQVVGGAALDQRGKDVFWRAGADALACDEITARAVSLEDERQRAEIRRQLAGVVARGFAGVDEDRP
jgi:hypothetical protein